MMALAVAVSLFEPDVEASDPQICELMAALAPGGGLHGQRLHEVLKHEAFKRIADEEPELRKELGKFIEKSPEYLIKLEKMENKAAEKLNKLKPKADRKAITAGPPPEQQQQIAKPKKKQGLAKTLNALSSFAEAARGRYLN